MLALQATSALPTERKRWRRYYIDLETTEGVVDLGDDEAPPSQKVGPGDKGGIENEGDSGSGAEAVVEGGGSGDDEDEDDNDDTTTDPQRRDAVDRFVSQNDHPQAGTSDGTAQVQALAPNAGGPEKPSLPRKFDPGDYNLEDPFIDDGEDEQTVRRFKPKQDGFFVATDDFEVVSDPEAEAAERQAKKKAPKRARSPKPRLDLDLSGAVAAEGEGGKAAAAGGAGKAAQPKRAKAAAPDSSLAGAAAAAAPLGGATSRDPAANAAPAAATTGAVRKTSRAVKRTSSGPGDDGAASQEITNVPWAPKYGSKAAIKQFETVFDKWYAKNVKEGEVKQFPRELDANLTKADGIVQTEHSDAARSHGYYQSMAKIFRMQEAAAIATILRVRRRAASESALQAFEVRRQEFLDMLTERIARREQEMQAGPPLPDPTENPDGTVTPHFNFDMDLRSLMLTVIKCQEEMVKCKNADVAGLEEIDKHLPGSGDLEPLGVLRERDALLNEWLAMWPPSMFVHEKYLKKVLKNERARSASSTRKKLGKLKVEAGAAATESTARSVPEDSAPAVAAGSGTTASGRKRGLAAKGTSTGSKRGRQGKSRQNAAAGASAQQQATCEAPLGSVFGGPPVFSEADFPEPE